MTRSDGITFSDIIRANLSYYSEAIKLLARYPGALSKSLSGVSGIERYIDLKLHEDYRRSPQEVAHVRGFDICLNPKDEYISSYISIAKSYELTTSAIFTSLVRRGSTIFDVGANVGWFTLLAARLSGPTGRVVSFEPEPTNFGLLTKSLELNHFGNVKLLQEAASDFDGKLTLYLTTAANMPGSHSTIRDFGMGSISIDATRLDRVASDLGIDTIQLLKIDVEGAEAKVLLGARSLLDGHKIQNIILEWNPEAWASVPDFIQRIFREFEVYEIGPPKPSPLKEVKADDLPTERPNLYLRLRAHL